jgi:hypothetical protein
VRNSISKSIVAALTALRMSTVISSTTPAAAVVIHGGGSHGGGFGGFHPGFVGGIHPGFRPGFVGFRPGFVGFHRRFLHPGFFVNGVWVNSWWGGYGNSCWDYRPVYDAWGNFLGQQYVNLCQY